LKTDKEKGTGLRLFLNQPIGRHRLITITNSTERVPLVKNEAAESGGLAPHPPLGGPTGYQTVPARLSGSLSEAVASPLMRNLSIYARNANAEMALKEEFRR
jgi:hypothetical protein